MMKSIISFDNLSLFWPQVPSEETVVEIRERYSEINAHAASYTFKALVRTQAGGWEFEVRSCACFSLHSWSGMLRCVAVAARVMAGSGLIGIVCLETHASNVCASSLM